jgi:hypothetical protein
MRSAGSAILPEMEAGMKKLPVLVGAMVFLACSPSVGAQNAAPPQASQEGYSRVEVYGGIGYGNLSSVTLASRKHSAGWGAAFTYNLSRYVGLTADFSGYYNPECSEQDFNCFLDVLRTQRIEDYSQHHFLAGPRLVAPVGNKRFFFHVLLGGARTHSSIFDLNTLVETRATAGPNFAIASGGGMDWSFGDRLAVRLFQVDAVRVHESGGWRTNVRVQGGIVVRFGAR